MKRSPLHRKTPLRRQPITTAPLTGKRKPLPPKRRTPRRWVNVRQRREYVANVGWCEYGAINGCRNPATDAEHFLGRGRHASDDPRVLLALCRGCHSAIGRGHAAAVNGLWLKLKRVREVGITVGYEMALLVEFWESLGFRVEVVAVWLTDGTLTDEAVQRRALDVMDWCDVDPITF